MVLADTRPSALHRRAETTLNWRFMLALAVNSLMWAGIVEAFRIHR